MKKLLITSLTLMLIVSCKKEKEKQDTAEEKKENVTYFYVGTYTDKESRGIYRYALSEDGSLEKQKLLAATENPSFLSYTADKAYLLAVNENETGTVESYQITPDSLVFINRSSSGGAHPCFVTTTPDNYVLTANYTGGNTGLLKLDANGKLSDLLDIHQHHGDTLNARQTGPHAHSVWVQPDRSLVEVDLGTNQLWFSEIKNDSLIAKAPATLDMNPGDGPRHMTFHPNGTYAYVINELSSSIVTLKKNAEDKWEKQSTISTLPADFKGDSYCADIHISSDGQYVYGSNRGHNSIAIFKVEENGELMNIGFDSVRGDWPRNFALSPDQDFLLVANQNSNNIIAFKRDQTTGLLTYVSEVAAPSPVCILF
ncbi:lactonase family protein [Zhouia amylolytica]|uniref:lactonase family protein n=1 Tax=Zhouia amylolytica TaxID=376730 RepID=UPI0020CC985B